MKNMIICSDGTWQYPESGTSTHTLRIARGIAPEDAAGNKQVAFYDWGVGSDGNPLTGGASGKGIDKNILDCYRFLVHNYDDGDAVYLFGFSRGAYTVRSLAGLIGNCGILRREHAGKAAAFRRDYAVAGFTLWACSTPLAYWAYPRRFWEPWARLATCFTTPSPAALSTTPAMPFPLVKTARISTLRCGPQKPE